MPRRGKLLSDFEFGQIEALAREGKTVQYISKQLKRSYNAVNKYMHRKTPYQLNGGRPQKLDDRTKRRIVREMLQNETVSLRNVIKMLNLSVSAATVHRFLQKEGFKYTKYLTAPFLNEEHKKKRAIWASDILVKMACGQINIKHITFSDEKRFCLDGPDGARHYWLKNKEMKKYFGKKLFGKSLMVWGGIGYNGTTFLHVADKSIDSTVYQSIITSAYLPFHNDSFILMQDNARPHVSLSTQTYMENHNINLLPWAANSPDCNPIENLWGILVRRVFEGNVSFNSIAALKRKILKTWDEITVEEVQRLVKSFPKRLAAVVAQRR